MIVINKTGKLIRDRFNGTDFEFLPNEKVNISPDAARHIFGYGISDQKEIDRILMRQGWMKNSDEIEPARARLARICFMQDLPQERQFVEDEPDPATAQATVPATDVHESGPKKVTARK